MTRTAEEQERIDEGLDEICDLRGYAPNHRRYRAPYQPTDQNLPFLGCALAGLLLVAGSFWLG